MFVLAVAGLQWVEMWTLKVSLDVEFVLKDREFVHKRSWTNVLSGEKKHTMVELAWFTNGQTGECLKVAEFLGLGFGRLFPSGCCRRKS